MKHTPWVRLILGAGNGVGTVTDPAPQDQGGATPPATAAPTDPAAAKQPDPNDQPLGETGLRALQAERDARAAAERAAAELAARVKSFEDANKTAEERAAEQLAEAQRTAAENATKALRYEIAAEAGLPLSAAGRLQGSTREEMLADAVSLKSLIGAVQPGPTTPKPDPRQGGGQHEPIASLESGRAAYEARHKKN
ncbi:hypothetical protein [Rhodococcus ruber]|uniref:hypothetical protein n=1 Tax=Rhodococcus ruber TaxID=1830 RepID=UPI003D812E2F